MEPGGNTRPESGRFVSATKRLALLLALTLIAGCAPRPGPEVLTPTFASVPGARVVTVYVATTRARGAPESNNFTTGRAAALNFAAFRISVPPGHRPGEIEWPQGSADPATSFATVEQITLDRTTFERRVAAAGRVTGGRKVGVYVHGYNRSFQESLFRLAQMTADADISGVPILFAWPSEAKVTSYVADKEAVTYSRDGLADLLTLLVRDRGNGRITVLAHSMGAWLTMEALRQLRLAGKGAVIGRLDVVLAAPDIDVDVFRAQLAVIGPLSPPMVVLVSRDDVALSVSSQIGGERLRVGALDVDDPRVQEAAVRANVEIVDISSLTTSDPLKHDRYASLAALYPRLAATRGDGAGGDLRRAGAFVFDAVGTTLSSPFTLAGGALAD